MATKTQKPRNLIADLASELKDRRHGEIFGEFYDAATDSGISIAQFIQDLKDQCKTTLEEDPDDQEAAAIMKLINEDNGMQAVIEYFDQRPNHGEMAGTAIGACWNDSNFVMAQQIFDKLDESGFDS